MVKYDISAVIKAQDQASQTFGKVEKSSKGLSKAFGKLGGAASVAGGMIVANLAMKAGAAVTSFIGGSIDAFSSFETSMASVSTLMGEGEDAMEIFGEGLKKLSEEIPVDGVNDLAQGLYQVLSAGIPAAEALEFLEIAAKGAKAGATSTLDAVTGLAGVLNAYKIPVSEAAAISDTFFATVKGGITTFPELTAVMGNVIPIAANVGVSFTEVMAAMATMTEQNIKTSVASTSLRQVMASMLKPTADMQAIITDLRFASGEAMLEQLGLKETIDLLSIAVGGSKDKLASMFGSVEALGAVVALTGANSETFAEKIDLITNASGAAETAFGIQADTHESKMQKMDNAMANMSMVLGEALVPALEEIATLFSENSEEIKTLFSVLGTLITGGIWVAIAAFKGFSIIGTALWDTFIGVGKAFFDMGVMIKDVWDKFIAPIVDKLSGFVDTIAGGFEWLKDTLVGDSIWTDMLDEMGKQSESKLPVIEQEFKGFSSNIAGGISQINPSLGGSGGGGSKTVVITGPLINIEGSANEETIEEAVARMKEVLENVVIESTSTDAVTSRIRP